MATTLKRAAIEFAFALVGFFALLAAAPEREAEVTPDVQAVQDVRGALMDVAGTPSPR